MEAIEEVEYEGLPPNAGLGSNLTGFSQAGISEHAVMFPVDSIKVHTNASFRTSPAAVYTGIGNAFTRISSTEGMRSLWRGVSSVIMGAGQRTRYISVHTRQSRNLRRKRGWRKNQWIATSLAGASATIASDALMNPFDVIKQRMQMHQSEFRSALTCARTVYRTEGLNAFYVSYPTTLTMTVPFTAVQFTVYEQLKTLLNPRAGNSQDMEIRHARGLKDAFRIIWTRDGLKGFSRGLAPRVLTFMPSNALCWMSYEFFKAAIRDDQ
ncbi:mitochondrial carrier [Irpex lacteus]|nr:mitochondrial carrier [Irpex lacteus]